MGSVCVCACVCAPFVSEASLLFQAHGESPVPGSRQPLSYPRHQTRGIHRAVLLTARCLCLISSFGCERYDSARMFLTPHDCVASPTSDLRDTSRRVSYSHAPVSDLHL